MPSYGTLEILVNKTASYEHEVSVGKVRKTFAWQLVLSP